MHQGGASKPGWLIHSFWIYLGWHLFLWWRSKVGPRRLDQSLKISCSSFYARKKARKHVLVFDRNLEKDSLLKPRRKRSRKSQYISTLLVYAANSNWWRHKSVLGFSRGKGIGTESPRFRSTTGTVRWSVWAFFADDGIETVSFQEVVFEHSTVSPLLLLSFSAPILIYDTLFWEVLKGTHTHTHNKAKAKANMFHTTALDLPRKKEMNFAENVHQLVMKASERDPTMMQWTSDGAAFIVNPSHPELGETLGKYFSRKTTYIGWYCLVWVLSSHPTIILTLLVFVTASNSQIPSILPFSVR